MTIFYDPKMVEAAEALGGEYENAAVHIERDGEHSLYILFINNEIVSVVLTQTKNSVTYIQFVDSTGIKRGYTDRFITGIVSSIRGLIACFSHPRSEPILGKSSACVFKKIRAPLDLFNYWLAIFKDRCKNGKYLQKMKGEKECGVGTWSNFRSDRSHPYKRIEDIELFEDDPISKMINSIPCKGSINTKELFSGLLVRSDFTCGGLLFSQCFCHKLATEEESLCIMRFLQRNDPANTEHLADKTLSWPAEDEGVSYTGRVFQIIRMLRKSSFSDKCTLSKETSEVISKFCFKLKYFRIRASIKLEGTNDTVIKLVPSRNRMA